MCTVSLTQIMSTFYNTICLLFQLVIKVFNQKVCDMNCFVYEMKVD